MCALMAKLTRRHVSGTATFVEVPFAAEVAASPRLPRNWSDCRILTDKWIHRTASVAPPADAGRRMNWDLQPGLGFPTFRRGAAAATLRGNSSPPELQRPARRRQGRPRLEARTFRPRWKTRTPYGRAILVHSTWCGAKAKSTQAVAERFFAFKRICSRAGLLFVEYTAERR